MSREYLGCIYSVQLQRKWDPKSVLSAHRNPENSTFPKFVSTD